MPIPQGREIAYECANDHVRLNHDIDHSADDGEKCVCEECGALLTRTLVPIRTCRACGHTWAYLGDADRPTCPGCKGKRTRPVAEQTAD
jgi:uncharacterized protein (DUF983 family)